MPGCRHLLDALPECSAAAHDVGNLGLVTVDFYCTWPKEIGGRVQIDKLCFHVFCFSWKKVELSADSRQLCYSIIPALAISAFTAMRCSTLSVCKVLSSTPASSRSNGSELFFASS